MVASETGHVYTFATPKLQPMITSEAGKALIQTCLHQPEPAISATGNGVNHTQERVRMCSSGYEETDLGGYMTGGDDGKNKVCMYVRTYVRMYLRIVELASQSWVFGKRKLLCIFYL